VTYQPPTRAEAPKLLEQWQVWLPWPRAAKGRRRDQDETQRQIIAMLIENEVRLEAERRQRTPLLAFTEDVHREELSLEDQLPPDIRKMLREMLEL